MTPVTIQMAPISIKILPGEEKFIINTTTPKPDSCEDSDISSG